MEKFWNLVKLSLLFSICALPSAALFAIGFFGLLGLPEILALALSLAAAFPVGGALCACMFCVTKMIRSDPGYLWHDFKRKFSENMKQATAPGILCAAFVYSQLYLWLVLAQSGADIGWLLAGLLSLLIFLMVAPYFFLQVAYIELKTSRILRNSILLAFGNAGRSFLGALSGGAIWLAYALFLPDSLLLAPLAPACGFALSMLLCLIWIWPPFDRQFGVEEALKKL